MTESEYIDKVARIALAIERAGGDHLGDVDSLHDDFMQLLKLVQRDNIGKPLVAAPHGGLNAEEKKESRL